MPTSAVVTPARARHGESPWLAPPRLAARARVSDPRASRPGCAPAPRRGAREPKEWRGGTEGASARTSTWRGQRATDTPRRTAHNVPQRLGSGAWVASRAARSRDLVPQRRRRVVARLAPVEVRVGAAVRQPDVPAVLRRPEDRHVGAA